MTRDLPLRKELEELLDLHSRDYDGCCTECNPRWTDSQIGCKTRVLVESLLREGES